MTLRIAVVLVVSVAIAAAWWLLQILGMPSKLSPDVLDQWLQSQGAVGPLLLMLLMIIAVVVGPIPTLPVSATAGLAILAVMTWLPWALSRHPDSSLARWFKLH